MRSRPNIPTRTRVKSTKGHPVDALFRQALELHRQGRLAEAADAYQGMLSNHPRHVQALHYLGVIALQSGKPEEAVRLISEAITLQPALASAHANLGLALQQLQRPVEALASFDAALALQPDSAQAHYNRATVLGGLGRIDDAIASYDRALANNPGDPLTHYNRGRALSSLGRLSEALLSYQKALAHAPGHVGALYSQGLALCSLGRPSDALASFDQVLSTQPGHFEALNGRGNALAALRRLDDALASYDRALAIRPDYAQAHNNRGNVLKDLQRFDEALSSYAHAQQLRPTDVDAQRNRAALLKEIGRTADALAGFDSILSSRPEDAGSWEGRADCLVTLGRPDEALESYREAYTLAPDLEFLHSKLLHAQANLCQWDGFNDSVARLEALVHHGEVQVMPFTLLSLLDKPSLHRKAAARFAQARHPANPELGAISARPSDGKIRVGYFSTDFREHPLAQLTAGLFESHRADRFEVHGFYFGPEVHDAYHARVSAAFGSFHNVRQMSSRDIARLARGLGIDIAVDLNGFTQGARTNMFALRCAPVQVSYLGYPGTMGCDYMDYLIADRQIVPEEHQGDYCENLVYLPHTYLVNDSKKAISERVFSRNEFGLPESAFVYCCFNSPHKIHPATFAGWMQILRSTPESVLWLMVGHPVARSNLILQAKAHGIHASRLIFADRMPLAEHLARQRLADLFLDTLPYNAHTTASDALWAGLPVLTCMGASFASRVASSLLQAVGLQELITRTQHEFEATAIALARDKALLESLRARLARNRQTMPLFDTRLFTRHLEAAYEEMHRRQRAGQTPAPFAIAP